MLLGLVRDRVGVDFSEYRQATIARRIRNRMLTVGVSSLDEYVDLAATSADEVEALADRLAIKVSRFYRNAVTFDLLRSHVVPLLRDAAEGRAVHVWCAGCGGGEEAYTLAMLLDEAGIAGTVDATDIDRAALAAAACGIYRVTALDELPVELSVRYLEPLSGPAGVRYRVRDGLRERVRFSWHDITASPPPAPGTFAIVSCRNVLIYLQPSAQHRALRHLCAGLRPGAALVLGEAEWPTAGVSRPLDVIGARARVFLAKGGWPGAAA